jgi:hypothetical protein
VASGLVTRAVPRDQRRKSESSSVATIESKTIEVIGMYTRTFSLPKRRSPGSRPNQDSAPLQASKPIAAMATPMKMSVGPQLRSIQSVCAWHAASQDATTRIELSLSAWELFQAHGF